MKQIKIHIRPNGMVQAETHGIKGKACTDYIKVLEELLDAETVHSTYTPEYFESQQVSVDVQTDNANRAQVSDGTGRGSNPR